MARIPTAADVRQVQPTQLRRVRVTDAAAGLDVHRANQERGQALGRVGQMLEQEAIKVRDREDTDDAKNLDVELSEYVRKRRFGDPNDPNAAPGYESLKGRAAVEGRAQYEADIQAKREELSGRAKTKTSRRRFERVAHQRQNSALEAGYKWSARQGQIAHDATNAGVTDALMNDIATNPNDTQYTSALREHLQKVYKEKVGGYEHLEGQVRIDAEKAAKSYVEAGMTDAHVRAIDILKVDDPEGAQKYYDKHKADISPEVRDDIESQLKSQVLVNKSQRAADELMSRRLGASATLAAAREEFTGKMRDEVVARIKVRNAEAKAGLEGATRAASAKLWNLVADGNNLEAIRKQLSSNEWALVARQMPNVQNVILSIARGEVDLVTSIGFETRFSKMSQADKAALPFEALNGQTTAEEKRRIIPQMYGAQAREQKRLAKTEDDQRKVAPYTAASTVLRKNAPVEWATAWDKNEKNQAKRDMGDILDAHMHAYVKGYMADNDGAPPSVPEMTAKAREIFSPGSDAMQSAEIIESDPDGTGVGETSIEVPAYLAAERMSEKQLADAYQDYATIPPRRRAEIENRLAKHGVPKRTRLVEQIAAAQRLGQTERANLLVNAAIRGVEPAEYKRLHDLPVFEQRQATVPVSALRPELKKHIREALDKRGLDRSLPLIEQIGAAYVLGDTKRLDWLLPPLPVEAAK